MTLVYFDSGKCVEKLKSMKQNDVSHWHRALQTCVKRHEPEALKMYGHKFYLTIVPGFLFWFDKRT